MTDCIVDTRWTNQLADDNTLSTVDDKRSGRCHKRKITHENLVLFDFLRLLVVKSDAHLKWCSISSITLSALINVVLLLISAKLKINELQAQMTTEISNWGNIPEHFFQSFVQEPLVRIRLYLNQVRHLKDFLLTGKTHSHAFAYFYWMYSVLLHRRFTP